MSISILCHGCGEQFAVPDDYERNKARCTLCGVYCPVPAGSEKSTPRKKENTPSSSTQETKSDEQAYALWSDENPSAPAPSTPASPEITSSSTMDTKVDEESEDLYQVTPEEDRPCPSCETMVPTELQACPQCGFNFETRKIDRPELPPFQRTWVPWLPAEGRWTLFLICSGVSLVLGVAGAISLGDWLLFLGPWLGLTALLAFLLGSFLRIDLHRSPKGKVKLTRTWFYCFRQQPTQRVRLDEYETVKTERVDDTGMLEWAIFLFFIPTILLAIAWWWFVMRRIWFQVALTHSHGYSACVLYLGGNEETMNEMANLIRETADFP